jgi:ABC-type antimicrobial peptide transport system permease subunit
VGVCDDVKQFGLDGGRTADLYIPLRQMPLNQAQFMAARMYWVLHTAADPMAVADGARAIVRRLDKDVATSSTRPILQILAASIGSRKFNTDLIRLAGLASLGLALLGVYAVTAFSVTRRTREIGIRITLGATPGQVLRPLLAEEWTALVTGLVLGAVGAVFVARALAPVLFAASGPEPRLIGGAVLVLGGVGALASYVPARRAARSDPAAALRIDQ